MISILNIITLCKASYLIAVMVQPINIINGVDGVVVLTYNILTELSM